MRRPVWRQHSPACCLVIGKDAGSQGQAQRLTTSAAVAERPRRFSMLGMPRSTRPEESSPMARTGRPTTNCLAERRHILSLPRRPRATKPGKSLTTARDGGATTRGRVVRNAGSLPTRSRRVKRQQQPVWLHDADTCLLAPTSAACPTTCGPTAIRARTCRVSAPPKRRGGRAYAEMPGPKPRR